MVGGNAREIPMNCVCSYLKLPGGHRRRARHVTVDDGRSNAPASVRLYGEEGNGGGEKNTEMHTGRSAAGVWVDGIVCVREGLNNMPKPYVGSRARNLY